MSKKFHSHYKNGFSVKGMLALLWATLRASSKRQRLAALNRFQDYLALQKQRHLYALHEELLRIIENGAESWETYDYGEGYFYQSFQRLGITGFRDTGGRVESMNLCERVEDMTVLEIGCNTGFLSLSIAASARSVAGFDLAPHLVEVARRCAEFLSINNVDFSTSSFEDFETSEQFDCVLSFANHSTFDGNSTLDLETFFDRCRQYLKPAGLFLFESHPPGLENEEKLAKTCEVIEQKFNVQSREVLNYGSFLDQNRTFIAAVNDKL